MYRLYGFSTQNSLKPLYVMEETGVDFDFRFVNLPEGENRAGWFTKMTPLAKVPVLEHDGKYLFESGAISRYVANIEQSPLYPRDPWQRALVDQWLDFYTCHLGRWLSTLYFENVIKANIGWGGPDEAACEEAAKYVHSQGGVIDEHLGKSQWHANDAISIADICAFAYIEQYRAVDFPMADFSNIMRWFDSIENRESISRARARLPA